MCPAVQRTFKLSMAGAAGWMLHVNVMLLLNVSKTLPNICLAALQVSGCRRYIKLSVKDAQQTYNQLQAMLQARLDSKAAGSSSKASGYVPGPQTYPQSPSVPPHCTDTALSYHLRKMFRICVCEGVYEDSHCWLRII
jgi:hypothetical protein